MREIPVSVLSDSLKHLILTGNNITDLSNFKFPVSLEHLNLDLNHLTSVPLSFITDLHLDNLVGLSINDNDLTTIEVHRLNDALLVLNTTRAPDKQLTIYNDQHNDQDVPQDVPAVGCCTTS